ncbi:MAG: MFS transporter [bacterium]|nr:MFS transporter [bacterium]MDD5353702.1 MFS transporter [bacterium]MDD5755670.1 MFS transporter [bacterium]
MFNIIMVGITSLLTDISTEMVYPLLAIFLSTTLGASTWIIGLIEGIAESIASLLKVFSGYLSDKSQKRKPLAILGYGSSTFGKIFLYIATSWWWVLLSRVIDRFGKGIRNAPRDALIADSSAKERRGRAFGLHRMMDTIGAATGVLIAYYLLTSHAGSIDYRKIFLISLIPAFLGLLFLFLVKEKKAAPASAAKKFSFNWSALPLRLKLFLVVTVLFTLGNSSNQFLLLRAKNLGYTTENVLLLYLVYNIVYAMVSYPAGRLSDIIGRKKLLVWGYVFYGVVYLGFALTNDPRLLWGLFGLYGIYIGMTEGVEKALVTDIAPEHLRATMIGLHATLVGIGLFPASFLAGILWNQFGPAATFYFGGITGLLAAVGLLLVL